MLMPRPQPQRMFVRACPRHRVPLLGDTLDCPRGHRLVVSDPEDLNTLRWLVLEQPSGRVAAQVYEHRVVFAAWFEDEALEAERFVLAGRSRAGFTPRLEERAARAILLEAVAPVWNGPRCKNGHPQTLRNSKTGGKQRCRTCHNEWMREYQRERRRLLLAATIGTPSPA